MCVVGAAGVCAGVSFRCLNCFAPHSSTDGSFQQPLQSEWLRTKATLTEETSTHSQAQPHPPSLVPNWTHRPDSPTPQPQPPRYLVMLSSSRCSPYCARRALLSL